MVIASLGFFLLGVGGVLLPMVGVMMSGNLLMRYGVVLLALAAFATALSLSLYAFSEDAYTSNGMSRWETHNSSATHALFVVAVSVVLLLAVTAAFLRQRPQRLRLVAAGAALTWPVLWWVSVATLVGN